MLKIENLHVSVERRAILNDVKVIEFFQRVLVEIGKIIQLAVSGSM
ncbi:hypothetical protein [Thermococcus alcaliphilus]|nr:hypothetical protein [Thermococcus alcaliphilus]MCO6041405.1 hypothetical protein [Thermococcus alcaliphilus]